MNENVTKVVPNSVQKRIDYNTNHYGKRIDQLTHILTDTEYQRYVTDFVISMYKALTEGRRITPKMEHHINNIVKGYAKWRKLNSDPNNIKKKTEYIIESNRKIDKILSLLSQCNYDEIYESRSEHFIQSLRKFLLENRKLTVKQRKALNSMYKRFEKRVKKVTDITSDEKK